jgi:hypothetical protein
MMLTLAPLHCYFAVGAAAVSPLCCSEDDIEDIQRVSGGNAAAEGQHDASVTGDP